MGQDELRALPLAPHASERRKALLTLYPRLQGSIEELDQEVCEEVQQHPQARRLLTHPGVGPITALASAEGRERSLRDWRRNQPNPVRRACPASLLRWLFHTGPVHCRGCPNWHMLEEQVTAVSQEKVLDTLGTSSF